MAHPTQGTSPAAVSHGHWGNTYCASSSHSDEATCTDLNSCSAEQQKAELKIEYFA